MNKLLFVILIVSMALSACLPAFLQPSGVADQNVAVQATIAAGLTSAAETLGPLASPTLIPSVTKTASATRTATHTLAPTTTNTPTETVFATLSTGTAVTPTNVTGTPSTPFLPTITSGSPTQTLFPRFFGTQPPDVAFGTLKLLNRSKSEVYISLQCVTVEGQISILEYPVAWRLEIQAPAGKYVYVAWVGGKKMSGQFSLSTADAKTITIYKDRIAIR